MGNFKTFLAFCIVHAMKVGTILCILIVLCGTGVFGRLNPENSWLWNFIVFCLIVLGIKFLFGGWSATSLKWMTWSVILSTIGGLGLTILGMNSGNHSGIFWVCLFQLIFCGTFGIWTARWIEEISSDYLLEDETPESLLEAGINYGFRNTFNAIMDDFESAAFYAYGRGVAVYSNLSIITGLILYLIYK